MLYLIIRLISMISLFLILLFLRVNQSKKINLNVCLLKLNKSITSSSLEKSLNSSKPILKIYSLKTEHKRPKAPNFNVYSRIKISTIPAHAPISETMTGNGDVKPNLDTNSDLDLPIALRKGIRTCTQHSISLQRCHQNTMPLLLSSPLMKLPKQSKRP